MTTANILSSAKYAFEAFVAKKNAKAVKLGCPEIAYTYGNTFTKVGDEEGNKYEYVEVIIDESQIKLNGWSIMGRIEENDGSVIVTGYGDLSAYRTADINNCDHCHTRRARKVVFIVKNDETGETKIVGSTCLNDFLGHKSALQYSALISWVELIGEIIEDEGWNTGGSRDIVFNTKQVLLTAAACIRLSGFVSRAKAEDNGGSSTADDVKYVLATKKQEEKPEITDEDKELVTKAVEWFETTTHNDSDFMYNLGKLVNSDHVKPRYIGILVALLPTYHRATAIKLDAAASNYIGNVGDKKVSFTAKCVKIVSFSTNYGVSHMHLFVTPEGNQIKYVTQNNFAKENEEMTFVATIKAHDEYNGVKQTIITRAKVI